MKKIYRVSKNYWATDSDGWQNWIDSTIISYHASEEGAKKKIVSLLEKEMLTIPLIRENNPGSDYADQCIDQYTRNYLSLYEDGNIDEPLFFYNPIIVED